VTAFYIASETIAGGLAGLLLSKSPWFTVGGAFSMLFLSIIASLALPETLEIRRMLDQRQQERVDEPAEEESSQSQNGGPSATQKPWRKLRVYVREIWVFVSANWRLTSLMGCYTFIVLSKLVQDSLLQYATKRYSWSWSRVSLKSHRQSRLANRHTYRLLLCSLSGVSALLLCLPLSCQQSAY
jgi:hypothetical protein